MPPDSSAPCASIVVPTRKRLDYLRVALASIAAQSAQSAAELIVVDDAGPSEQARQLAERFGARYEPHPRPLGLNVARNTGVERSHGELVVFVDDDVEVCPGWLDALLAAAREHPKIEVFTGPIVPRLEGSPPRTCGREGAPITALDLGPEDAPTRFAWGANMAIRRDALERVGPFNVALEHGGDEQEWQERLLADRGSRVLPDGADHERIADPDRTSLPVLYVAGAALDHRRNATDARLLPLCRAALARGKAARRFDAWRGTAPSLGRELTTLLGCLGHVIRRRCPAGLAMVAHSGGRVTEAMRDIGGALAKRSQPARVATGAKSPADAGIADRAIAGANQGSNRRAPEDFLSGESGTVGGLDGLRRGSLDIASDVLHIVSGRRRRLERAARRVPPTRRVLVLGIERPEHSPLARGIRAELARSRHDIEMRFAPPGDRGKFENLNLLLDQHPPDQYDWLLVVDDDIVLPSDFLDRFLFLAERFQLDLAQPAHRLSSHAAWQVTRRRPASAVRETRFVEIGPVTAFAHSTFSTLLPFPDLRMGWGLDLHWAALAREHGWRCGVLDAIPISHRAAPAASAYSREQALTEARIFLKHRAYLSASEAQQTLVTHRRW
ncbi:MAG TPA: glycosyltransferase [Solirubrobacteraceae bacterium]